MDDVRKLVPNLLAFSNRASADDGGRWPKLVTLDFAWELMDLFREHLCVKETRRALFREARLYVQSLVNDLRRSGRAQVTLAILLGYLVRCRARLGSEILCAGSSG